jgi:predicted O-methyltransferase YrrM
MFFSLQQLRSNILHWALWNIGLAYPDTQTTASERAALTAHASGRRRLVEIGVWHGVTTRMLRQVMSSDGILFAVDPYPPSHLGFSVQQRIAHREVCRERRGTVQWLQTTGVKAAELFPGLTQALADFVFIDGDHSYQGLKDDWESWSPLVAGGGIVALHDSRSTPSRPIDDAGSVRYTAEMIVTDTRFSVLDVIDSLTVLRRISDMSKSKPPLP